MARLITVAVNCRNEAVRQTFEEIVSRRRDYLIAKGQGTGALDMVLIEMDELRPQQTFSQVRDLLATAPELEVFVTASRTDPQWLLEGFRIGVKEFLPQPLTRNDVDAALLRFEERFRGRVAGSAQELGRLVSVIGARGGVGTSTVAVNLAMSVQQARRNDVALMDLDLHGGDLDLFLDLHPEQGLKQLSKDISRLDETIVKSSLLKHVSGLHLLSSGHDGFEETEFAEGSVMRVMGLLRSMHRHVFVDCGHVLEPAVKEALDCSDQIIVLTTLSLPTIRRTKRLLETFAAAQYPSGRVAVVVNRYTNDQKDLLDETEEMLGVRMAGLIPNDYLTASEAIDHGKPLSMVAAKTTIAQWYLRGSDEVLGGAIAEKSAASEKGKKQRGSFLGRYLPSFG